MSTLIDANTADTVELRIPEKCPIDLGGPSYVNRVSYQGITYTICRCCFELIGSGTTECALAKAEASHSCPAMDGRPK